MASTAPSTLPKAVTRSTGVSTAFFTTPVEHLEPVRLDHADVADHRVEALSPAVLLLAQQLQRLRPVARDHHWCPSSPRICAISPREAMSSSTTRM